MWQHGGMARMTRAESKERTRQRLLAEAQRLFRERGYAATSLEQIAEAAEVTKGRAVAAESSGDTEELAMYLEFFAALLRAPDALQRYSSSRERRLLELADADRDELPTGVTSVQAWAIGQAMLVGLQIYKRLAPGLVTPEVFERAFGLLADLYQEQ
jgi:AcrR family transcriptional regulator